MSPKAIVEVWENTATVFEEHNVPLSENSLETLFKADTLNSILAKLNEIVGSSTTTCIEGG
ncbi:hypothetical protein [Cytobacillus gottheilii]|uniref:hypothetical protein n=1 Tax=Cytobacillus gottheilii TaxID=859144 RepID=UPI002493F0D8|nr:hypothetical protein [Cytobacillus gottheilii]